LRPFEATPAPTVGQLAEQWRGLRRAMDDVGRPANLSWYDSLLAKASSLVRIRPSADAQGDAPDVIFARVSGMLARGDLSGALASAQKLKSPPQPVAAWIARANEVAAARETAQALAAEGVAALGRAREPVKSQ
jgi:hypothetical protein